MSNVIECEFESVDFIREQVRTLGATNALAMLLKHSPEHMHVFIKAVVKNTIKRWR